MHEGSRRAILAAFPADLGIAIAELIGVLDIRSAGLLAGAGHPPADAGNQRLLLLGGTQAAEAADTLQPSGDGRERHRRPRSVAKVRSSLGGSFALHEASTRFAIPTRSTGSRAPSAPRWWSAPSAWRSR